AIDDVKLQATLRVPCGQADRAVAVSKRVVDEVAQSLLHPQLVHRCPQSRVDADLQRAPAAPCPPGEATADTFQHLREVGLLERNGELALIALRDDEQIL